MCFPFKWSGITHKGCRSDNKCATSVDQSNMQQVYGLQWGYCGVPNSCNKDECTTVGGSSVGTARLHRSNKKEGPTSILPAPHGVRQKLTPVIILLPESGDSAHRNVLLKDKTTAMSMMVYG